MSESTVRDDRLGQLERLGQLRAEGILTDEEFAAQKAAVLSGDGPEPPPSATTDAEPGYDGATENLALAGYIFAVVFPLIGLILGILLLGRNRPKAGWVVIGVSSLLIITGAVLGIVLISQESQPVEGGLRDAILGE